MYDVLNFHQISPKISTSVLDLPSTMIIPSLSTSVTVPFILSTKYSLFLWVSLKWSSFLGFSLYTSTLTILSLEQFFSNSNSPNWSRLPFVFNNFNVFQLYLQVMKFLQLWFMVFSQVDQILLPTIPKVVWDIFEFKLHLIYNYL